MMNLHLAGADVRLDAEFLSQTEADRLFLALRETIPWEQRSVTIKGESYPMPRLTAWFGDEGANYTYSGSHHEPSPWTEELDAIRELLRERLGVRFNSMLANLYRAGRRDSIGMHSDSERELGRDPVIASISLGRACDFVMAPKKGQEGRRTVVKLTHGSLLLMGEGTQRRWMHGIEKETRPATRDRINLTFRTIVS